MKDIKQLKEKAVYYLRVARKHATIIFLIFLFAIYGTLSWRIFQLLQAEPNPADVSAKLNTVGVPKVDDNTVNKMESLIQSNVSVHALYDESRSNPFQE